MGHKSKKHNDRQDGLAENDKLPCDLIEQECEEKSPPKKKKRKKTRHEVCHKEDEDPRQENVVKAKKSKKRKTDKDGEDEDLTPTTVVHSVDHEEVIHKKSKKKKSKKSSELAVEKERSITDEQQTIDADEAKFRKEKKAKKKKEKTLAHSLTLQPFGLKEDREGACRLSKRKRKESREISDETPNNDLNESSISEGDQERSVRIKNTKRKTQDNSGIDDPNIPPLKKKKKEKHEEMGDEATSIGNNEVKKSENDSQENGSSTLGQWATAGFESSARQNKFIRLLGGHKKDSYNVNPGKKLFGSTSTGKKSLFGSLGQAKTHANFAMSLEQQKKFESDMNREYEKALGLKFNNLKSGGLGYEKPPGEGKTFYIDTNKSNSVKFDG